LCGRQIDLVGADAEAADRRQLRRARQHRLGQQRARPDPEEVRVGDLLDQRLVGKRLGRGHDLRVAVLAQRLDGPRVDAFEQDELQ